MRWWPLLFIVSCAAPGGPSLASVEPSVIDATSGGAVTLRGAQWLPPARFDFDRPERSTLEPAVVSAFLVGDGGARVELDAVTWVDATQVTAQVPSLAMGVYDVHLIEPRGAELVLQGGLTAGDCFGGACADAGPCDEQNYRDFDLDGYGSGAPQNRCGAGYAPRDGDCDSFDDRTHPGAAEVCNGLDDDCDGVIDTPACTAWSAVAFDAGAALRHAASPSRDQLWAASTAQVFGGGSAGLVDLSAGCAGGITAIATQSSGALEVSSPDVLQRLEFPGSCSGARAVDGGVVSMMSFGVRFVGVAANGDIWRWTAGGEPTVSEGGLPTAATVTAAHGISETQLIAVGTQGNAPRAWRLEADGRWRQLSSLPWNTGRLTAVWMVSATDAVLVGDDGTMVLRYSGGWFNARSFGVNDDFTSVRAFSLGRVYVTTDDGRVRQRSGDDWRTLYTAPAPLRAIVGVAEDGLWAVGDDGVVLRGAR